MQAVRSMIVVVWSLLPPIASCAPQSSGLRHRGLFDHTFPRFW